MKIIKTEKDAYFNKKSLSLGWCYLLIDKDQTSHYEFVPQKHEALVITDDEKHLEMVVERFHQEHKAIHTYYTANHDYYQVFDKVQTFYLPISILQVSELFLNEAKLKELEPIIQYDNLYFPVQIIHDEYVVLNYHHELYLAYQEGIKMVPVYLDTPDVSIQDLIYIAKEQNLHSIKDIPVLDEANYLTLTEGLENILNNNH